MGIKLIGVNNKRKRFRFENEREREVLDDARNFFGDSHTLLTKGLDYSTTRKNSSGCFYCVRNGKVYVSIENWEKIQEYASRYRSGEISEGVIILEV